MNSSIDVYRLTLKDITKGSTDYGYKEAENISESDCKHIGIVNRDNTGCGWRGVYSAEKLREILKESAENWINAMDDGYCWCHESYHMKEWKDKVECVEGNEQVKSWIRHFFNLEEE